MADQFANAPESPATAAQQLPTTIRELHRAVLRRFLDHGRCHRDDLRKTANALGVELDDALYRLKSDDLVHTAADGHIEVAYPFSGRPTTHTVHLTGRPPVAAMCAIDALGIPLMNGSDGVIYSADPVSQKRIQIRRHGSDWIWQPASAVVVISRTDCCGTLARLHASRLPSTPPRKTRKHISTAIPNFVVSSSARPTRSPSPPAYSDPCSQLTEPLRPTRR